MSRIQLASLGTGLAQNPSGGVLSGLSGTIYIQGTENPVTVWSAFTGGTSNSTGTFITDSFGHVPGWVDPDAYPSIDITIPPASTITVSLAGGGGASANALLAQIGYEVNGIDSVTHGVTFNITSDFGISAETGLGYYDDSGASIGEAATVTIAPETGTIELTLINGQTT